MAQGIIIEPQEKISNLIYQFVNGNEQTNYYEVGDCFDLDRYDFYFDKTTYIDQSTIITEEKLSIQLLDGVLIATPSILKTGTTTVTVTFFYKNQSINIGVPVTVEPKLKPWGECSWQDIHNICQMRQGDNENDKPISEQHFKDWVKVGYEKDLMLNYRGSKIDINGNTKILPCQLDSNSSDFPKTTVPSACSMVVTDILSETGKIVFISKYILYYAKYNDENGPNKEEKNNKIFTEDCAEFYKAMMLHRPWLVRLDNHSPYYVTIPTSEDLNLLKEEEKPVQSVHTEGLDFQNKQYGFSTTGAYLTKPYQVNGINKYRSDKEAGYLGGFVPKFVIH